MIPAPPDSPDEELPSKAAEKREKIVAEDATRTWRGRTLKPWSMERGCLLETLCAADVPAPDLATCSSMAFYHGMFPWAVKALYLATHEPADWERQRPRLLSVIAQWGFEEAEDGMPNVPGETIEEKAEAVNFVHEMISAHHDVRAMQRVKRMGSGSEAGN